MAKKKGNTTTGNSTTCTAKSKVLEVIEIEHAGMGFQFCKVRDWTKAVGQQGKKYNKPPLYLLKNESGELMSDYPMKWRSIWAFLHCNWPVKKATKTGGVEVKVLKAVSKKVPVILRDAQGNRYKLLK